MATGVNPSDLDYVSILDIKYGEYIKKKIFFSIFFPNFNYFTPRVSNMWQETWTVSNSEFTSSRLKTWESLIAPSNRVIFLLKLFNIRLQKGKTGHFDTKSFWHQLKRWNPPKNFVHESVVCAEQEIYFG